MKNPIPLFTVDLIPQINLKYSSEILLTIRGDGVIIITDLETKKQTQTSVPKESTIVDIIQTVSDCLPLN